jgi:hypothetical protein
MISKVKIRTVTNKIVKESIMRRASLTIMMFVVLAVCNYAFANEKVAMTHTPPVETPLPAYTILETTYKGIAGEDCLEVQAEHEIKVLKEGPTSIPILSREAAVTGTKLPRNILLTTDEKNYNLLCYKKGTYNISFSFVLKITKTKEMNVFKITPPDSIMSSLTLLIDQKDIEIEVDPPVSMQIKELDNQTQLTTFLGAAKEVEIKWPLKPSALTAVKPKFISENNTLVTISPGVIRTTSILNYTIMQGKISRFVVSIPADINLLSVKGDALKDWNIKRFDGKQFLEVELLKEFSDAYKLILETEIIHETNSMPLSILQIATQDAERQTGHIAIVVKEGLKILPTEKSGISQINTDQLPKEFTRVIKDNISLAFRYLKQPVNLSLNVRKIEPEISARSNIFLRIDEQIVKLSVLVDYTVQKAGVFTLPLQLPGDFTIVDVQADSLEDWIIARQEDMQVLKIQLKNKVMGNFRLLVRMEKPINDVTTLLEGIDVPQIKISDVKKHIAYIGISSVSNIMLKTHTRKNLVEIAIEELIESPKGMEARPSLAYKCIEQPYELKLSVEEVDPRITAEVFNFLSVGEGLLLVNSAITYNILYAGIDEFTFTLPDEAQAVEITGRNIKSKEEVIVERIVDGKKIKEKVWKVHLHSKTKGVHSIYCSFQKLIEDTSTNVELPGLQVLNVERETGYYCLGPRTSVEIEPDVVTGCSQIDIRELPQDKTTGIDVPLVLAYRYVKQLYKIKVDIKRHEDVSVMVAMAESAQITTVLTKEGQTIVKAHYRIKNKQKQYLTLSLPDDVDIWSTFVNNKPVKPARTEDGKILVPLEKHHNREYSFPVEIIYLAKISALNTAGKFTMVQPKLDIPLTNIAWRTYLPKEFSYFGFKGNMELAKEDKPVSVLPQSYSYSKDLSEKENIDAGKSGRRLAREQDEDFFDNIEQQVTVYNQQILQSGQRKRTFKGKQEGVLPILAAVPTGGKLITFNKLFSSDELLSIETYYSKNMVRYLWLVVIVIATIVVIKALKLVRFLKSRRQATNNSNDQQDVSFQNDIES